MKKIFLILLIFTINIFNFNLTQANNIEIKVTERIPGVNCTPKTGPCPEGGCTCSIEPGFNTIAKMIGEIIKWLAGIAALAGVLLIVVNGIRLSMGGIDSSAKEDTKKMISRTIIGLILLLLSGVILSIIAPWVFK